VLQVVNCVIQQKVGAGLHYNCVTHWDAKHDSSVTVKFENDSLTCVVMIFGISI
jgi:dynein light chain Tctex-type 1